MRGGGGLKALHGTISTLTQALASQREREVNS